MNISSVDESILNMNVLHMYATKYLTDNILYG